MNNKNLPIKKENDKYFELEKKYNDLEEGLFGFIEQFTKNFKDLAELFSALENKNAYSDEKVDELTNILLDVKNALSDLVKTNNELEHEIDEELNSCKEIQNMQNYKNIENKLNNIELEINKLNNDNKLNIENVNELTYKINYLNFVLKTMCNKLDLHEFNILNLHDGIDKIKSNTITLNNYNNLLSIINGLSKYLNIFKENNLSLEEIQVKNSNKKVLCAHESNSLNQKKYTEIIDSKRKNNIFVLENETKEFYINFYKYILNNAKKFRNIIVYFHDESQKNFFDRFYLGNLEKQLNIITFCIHKKSI